MKIPFTKFDLSLIANVDKKLPESRNIMKTIVKKQLSRQNENIKKWRDAITAAESQTRPSRLSLIRVYQDLSIDAHLTTVMNTRTINIQSIPFKIIDANGEHLEELQEKTFNKEWFFDLIKLVMESQYFGYSLIQLGSIKDDEFEGVKLVPREHIIPEKNQFLVNISDSDGPDFTLPPYSDWNIWVNNDGLGMLNNAAPLAIWKKTVFGAWSEFNEVFGNPLVIGRTDIEDPDKRKNMEGMLDSLIDASWGVFSEDDNLEVISGIKVGGHNTFRDELKFINEELSKLFLGQTMTTEDGASRSQSEVHERTMNAYTQSDMRFIWSKINNLAMPLLFKHGLIPEGAKFKFSTQLKPSVSEKQDFVIQLLNSYDIDPDFIESEFNIPVIPKAMAAPIGDLGNVENKIDTVMNDVNRLYQQAYTQAHEHAHNDK